MTKTSKTRRAAGLTRNALLAGSLVGAVTAGCTGGSGPKADAGPVADAGNIDVADADPTEPDAFPPMPYGAPPKRSRRV